MGSESCGCVRLEVWLGSRLGSAGRSLGSRWGLPVARRAEVQSAVVGLPELHAVTGERIPLRGNENHACAGSERLQASS
jgi:hypothetical protein